MEERQPVKVAIIGGGCAGITTAYELTRPELLGRYEVTVYQVGWRLGGKGASGRGPADRIEEHGLHVWMGFYENAFQLLRECYAELGRDPDQCRIADWQQAFIRDPLVGVVDEDRSGKRQNWLAHFPPTPGLPGDPSSDTSHLDIRAYLARTAGLLRTMLGSLQKADPVASHPTGSDAGAPTVESVREGIGRLFKFGAVATLAGLSEAARLLESMLTSISGYPESLPLRILDEIGESTRRQLAIVAEQDLETRRLWEIIDVLLAVLRGAVRFGLATDPRGLDSIDEYDWCDWLLMNGASKTSVDSAFMRGNYALMFAYENGDVKQPRMAAGQALRGAFRMFFTYRGALFWKMTAGMGDVVFAPYYQVLQKRGVRFEFFHRLENVRLADPSAVAAGEPGYVEALEFDVQAEVAGGQDYKALFDVRDLPCWPAGPDWSQLVDGAQLEAERREFESYWDQRKVSRKTLKVGEHFDFAVLAIGLGAVPQVCSEILERDRRWQRMVDSVGTVATQAFQIWLREDVKQLGWNDPSVSISAFEQPFETWADMPQLLKEESWPTAPGAIAYYCGVLPDPVTPASRSDVDYPAKRHDEVRATAVNFLNRHVSHFWPNAVHRYGGFRWDLLLTPDGIEAVDADETRFDSQFFTANVNPSDRYVLCLPGTQSDRISPLDYSYDNLTIAGDWTACGHAAGCVEAAVISGRLAAHAISGLPKLENIIGYDHP